MLGSGDSSRPCGGDVCALTQAFTLQVDAAEVGFDWAHIDDVVAKVREETGEVTEAIAEGDGDAAGREVGDLLFSVVNLARFLQVDPCNALLETNRRFASRFDQVKAEVSNSGRNMSECSLEELDEVWERVKANGTDC